MKGLTRILIIASLLTAATALAGEETIKKEAVPKAVIKSVKKAHPKAKINKAERFTRGAETLYEIYLKEGKQKLEVVLGPTGKILEPEEKEDDDKEEGE